MHTLFLMYLFFFSSTRPVKVIFLTNKINRKLVSNFKYKAPDVRNIKHHYKNIIKMTKLKGMSAVVHIYELPEQVVKLIFSTSH